MDRSDLATWALQRNGTSTHPHASGPSSSHGATDGRANLSTPHAQEADSAPLLEHLAGTVPRMQPSCLPRTHQRTTQQHGNARQQEQHAQRPGGGRRSQRPYKSGRQHTNSTAAGALDCIDGPRKPRRGLQATASPFQPSQQPIGPSTETFGPSPCVICCEAAEIVALGSCQHADAPICARCCLRQRMCYNVSRCALCNMDQNEVVIMRWAPGGLPSFAQLEARRGTLWQRPQWARGVLVHDMQVVLTPGSIRRVPLHVVLQHMTGFSCPGCLHEDRRPFPSMKGLLSHLDAVHPGKRLCRICLEARREFPLELELHATSQIDHHMSSHPGCKFCQKRFFGPDELYSHMQELHFACEVCQRSSGTFNHFENARALTEHLRESHHPCVEALCQESFVAFRTADELQDHRRMQHSLRMPRFQRSQARRVDIDVGRHRSLQAGPPQPRSVAPAQNGIALSSRHAMIDDDIGLSMVNANEAEAFPGLPTTEQRQQPTTSAWELQRQRQVAAQAEASFPSLGQRSAFLPGQSTAEDAARRQYPGRQPFDVPGHPARACV